MPKSYIIVYLDLVGYSKNNEPIQIDLFKRFQKEIHHLLYDEILDNDCILIPTGDGIIAGIENIKTSSYLKSFELVVGIIDWTISNDCDIRCAIHVGDVNVLKDINRKNNIIGNTINDAARILTGADDGGIIVSKTFYNKFLRKKNDSLGGKIKINDDWSFTLIDEDTVIDKHSFEHNVYNIILSNKNKDYGKNTKILTKYFTNIYSNDYPKKKNLDEKFLERVKHSAELEFIGIYHPSLPSILNQIDINEHRKIKINIYYAKDEISKQIEEFFGVKVGKLNLKEKSLSIDSIKKWYESLNQKSNITLNIYEYSHFIPFGASLVDKGFQGKGFIHISNYLPRILPDDTPYIEVEWKTNDMPPLYSFYYKYLNDFMFGKQQNILEYKLK
ncbi:MAG: hypothetical protein A2Y41_10410 [Spirochaetes bacterium GWB1_36_13]|nr:MAG: hypothetical protein A2Y41_10410 [Spirochaetes bacterium GWB1_36_13]